MHGSSVDLTLFRFVFVSLWIQMIDDSVGKNNILACLPLKFIGSSQVVFSYVAHLQMAKLLHNTNA